MGRERRRRPAPRGDALVRLGARIRELRERAGMTQRELAGQHVTTSGLSRIESGASAPSFALLVFLAKRLRTRVRNLVPPEL